jgi:branched-chain amino acid transport system substrate-binding protein
MAINRRTVIKLGSASAAAAILPGTGAMAQVKDVKVALIAPLSGPWARQGELMKKGGDLAIKHINEAGGIKSLGGAKMQLIVVDAGDSAEKAKNAAQRMVSQEPDLIGGTGAWLSTFTLAVTEVTERASLPMLTLSYSDQITARDHRFVFQTSPTAGAQATAALPTVLDLAQKATGKRPTTAAIIMDNTASPVSFAKPMREGGLEKAGVKLLVDEIFTPPLADATPIVQKVRSARPEILLLIPTAVSDDKLILEKLNEFGLGKGRLPVIANGAHIGAPELLRNVGAELLEGLMFIVANWGAKGQEKIIDEFKKETGEPWITQDSMCTYGDLMIFKEALESAGKADRVAVAEAIRKMDTTTGPAHYFPGNRVKFLPNGRRDGAAFVIVQWQKGVPVVVFPEQSAIAAPIWPKS